MRHKATHGRDAFDPYIDGYEAKKNGNVRTANPYREPDAKKLWDDGWKERAGEDAQRREWKVETNS